MSDIVFVNVIGSVYVYFRFNSYLISAYALIIILLYFLNLFLLLLRREAGPKVVLIYVVYHLSRANSGIQRISKGSSIYMFCLPLG